MHDLALFSECHIKELEGLTLSERACVFVLNSPGICVLTNIISETEGKEHFLHPGKHKHGIKEKLCKGC